MGVLYLRVGDDNQAWLRMQAAATGLSQAALVDSLLSAVRAQGVTFIKTSAIVGRAEISDAKTAGTGDAGGTPGNGG